MALHVTATASEPELLLLPWSLPLASWPGEVTVALPRGISRHEVRFVRGSAAVLAVKEIEERFARREYALLFDLQRRNAPCVEPVGVVSGRVDAAGEPLPAALVTRHLAYSRPYRVLVTRSMDPQLWGRLLDALVVLLVRLHLLGFAWNDCSLSNTLFRRDAGEFAAYLVDAETGELHPNLSAGQRRNDIEIALLNVMGELMDLQAGGFVPADLDPAEVGDDLRRRYEHLWMTLTDPVTVTGDDRTPIYTLIRTLNGLGFDVGELTAEADAADGGTRISVRAKVVDAGHHRRRMTRLTGLDMQENQARRLLNDLDSFRLVNGWSDERAAARTWTSEVYERVLERVPRDLRGRLEDAELVHEVMAHRWFSSQRAGHDVGLDWATDDYVESFLRNAPDEAQLVDPLEAAAEDGAVDEPSPAAGEAPG